MTKAIRVHAAGGPEVLLWEDCEVPEPGPDEVRIRHTAVGLNFIDVYFRTALYPPPAYPFVPGMEAAGQVISVGSAVDDFALGDRVAYAGRPMGAYAEERLMPAERLVRVPEGVQDELAAAVMLKGMTAHYLLRGTYRVRSGDAILVHAAAGGVGSILCQWGRHLGAVVIGTVSTEEKAEQALADGCQHPIIYTRESFVERVREITEGRGVAVVYDSVGADTFIGSLDCLAPRGTMVSFGQSSGPPEALALSELSSRGSLFLTRPSLMDYTESRAELEQAARELFEVLRVGAVRCLIGQRYSLSEASRAHSDLEGRRTLGSSLLLP